MTAPKIKIKFSSPQQFASQFIKNIINFRFLAPYSQSFPSGTPVEIVLVIPELDYTISLKASIISCIDKESARSTGRQSGMYFRIDRSQVDTVKKLNYFLTQHPSYSHLIPTDFFAGAQKPHPDTLREDAAAAGEEQPIPQTSEGKMTPPADGVRRDGGESGTGTNLKGDRVEELRHIIRDCDTIELFTKEEQPSTPPIKTHRSDDAKREFTASEREALEPVAAFILDLTKAMLRSGYYAPDHPGSHEAKQGIYQKFQNAMIDGTDMTLTKQEVKGRTDVLISGVLDDQVSLRALIGSEQATIFIPKLQEYYTRKSLISFSLKKDLTLNHFEDFIDIMSDPKVDKGSEGEVGTVLTSALIDRGITEVSTVFMDDILMLDVQLPWRVEMAIQRLAKDLKVLPMFKDKSTEEIQEMKIRIVKDIVRPLREPHMLKDIVVNAHIIAKNVAQVKVEDLEHTIVQAFPMEILLPTSAYVFEELTRVNEELKDYQEHPVLLERLAGMKRILKWVSERVVKEEVQGGEPFLEQLYNHDILTFEELPVVVQDHINTLKITQHFKNDPNYYMDMFKQAATEKDILLLLRFFRRILPYLMEDGAYQHLLTITQEVTRKFRADPHFHSQDQPALSNPISFIWKDSLGLLEKSFEREDKQTRAHVEDIIKLLGSMGVNVLIDVLMQSDSRSVRKTAVNMLIKMGDIAFRAINHILEDADNPWYLHRNALVVLAQLGNPKASDTVTRMLGNPNPRVREEALATLVVLQGRATEPKIIRFLADPDTEVRKRAVWCAGKLRLQSPKIIREMVEILSREDGKDPEERQKNINLKVEVINSLTAIGNIPVDQDTQVEDLFLSLLLSEKKWSKKLFKRVGLSSGDEQQEKAIQDAALRGLWKIGTKKTIKGLEMFAEKSDKSLALKTKEAIKQIRTRAESA